MEGGVSRCRTSRRAWKRGSSWPRVGGAVRETGGPLGGRPDISVNAVSLATASKG